jgi:septum formation protein
MLILASGSPRRSEILTAAGIPFRVHVPGIEEEPLPGEAPHDYVRRLARDKADAIQLENAEAILAADTVVVVDEHILEKPADGQDAARMLRLLSGREHFVITGICLRSARNEVVDAEATKVRFIALSEAEITEYVASGEPMGKAGAYAIQGLGCRFIDRVEGCYFNVVGLPISLVYKHLKAI